MEERYRAREAADRTRLNRIAPGHTARYLARKNVRLSVAPLRPATKASQSARGGFLRLYRATRHISPRTAGARFHTVRNAAIDHEEDHIPSVSVSEFHVHCAKIL